MTQNADLIAKWLAQREEWVALEEGLRVRVRRPAETDVPRFVRGIAVDDAAACVVGWDGFTEARILGPTVGSTKAVPFDGELWRELLRDNVEWLTKVADKLVDLIRAHLDAREAARKN